MRERFQEALKSAMRAKEMQKVGAIRLILSTLKDRDIAVREKGNYEGIKEDEILQMLQGMIKQRRESIAMYEQGGRPELAAKESSEIDVIQSFLPAQLSEEETRSAIKKAIQNVGALSPKDIGKVMAALRTEFVGRMDFSKVADLLKQHLQ